MKVAVYTLGCKVNIYESEYVISLLKKHHYDIVSFDDKADIYIINTCSVTNESDRKSRKIIHKAKKNNPGAIVIAMGCYSQVKNMEIDADIIIGNKDKSKIISLIEEYIDNHHQIRNIYDLSEAEFEPMEIDKFENHTRAFVKIQDGCNAFCSYCIIPYTRGNIRSKKEADVIKEVTTLVNNGYQEIVLTGIHTGKYGVDLNTNLESLLRKLIKIPNLYRLRLSSIEINELTDGIINLFSESDILANHLHIPLQSGCDKILNLMNRRYNTKYFRERVVKIRNARPNISLTTDLIVGFPMEDEEDFTKTLKFIKEINFTKIHTFPYSLRHGTKASMMPNQIDTSIKKNRVRKVLELSHKLECNYYLKFLNQSFEVVTEEVKNNQTYAHSSNFLPVVINQVLPKNKKIIIKIIDVIDDKIYAKFENYV